MATHDYIISNASGASVRADLNNALAAIVSNNSNATSPATTYAFQFWADTTTGQLKIRNAANSAWITLMELDGTMLMEDGSAASPGLAFASDLDTGFFSSGANRLNVSTGGAERLEINTSEVVFNDNSNDLDFRVESNGNANMLFVDGGNNAVGIGVGTPTSVLDVRDTNTGAEAAIKLFNLDQGNTTTQTSALVMTPDVRANGAKIAVEKEIADFSSTANRDIAITFSSVINNTATERLRIDSSGNLGIGAVAPAAKLDVAGNQIFTAADPQIQFNAGGPIIRLPAANTLAFLTDSTTERARIDSSGRFLVSTSTSRIVEDHAGNGPQGKIQIEDTDSGAIASIISAGTSDANRCGTLSLGRHRNSTVGGTPTVVQSGDALGAICFAGGDGTDMRTKGAKIVVEADDTPASNAMPGRLLFSTTARGASNPTERLRIDARGILGVGATPSAWGGSRKAIQFDSGGAAYICNDEPVAIVSNMYFDGSNNKYLRTDSASQVLFNTGSTQFLYAASGTAGNNISFGTAATVDSDGIKFQGDTAAANALDDYEEGAWTPAAFDNANGASTQVNRARYTKIGNRVCFECYIRVTKGTNGSSDAYEVHGLPYPSTSASSYHAGIAVSYFSGWGTSVSMVQGTVQSGGDHVLIRAISGTGSTGTVSVNGGFLGSVTELILGGSYEVA